MQQSLSGEPFRVVLAPGSWDSIPVFSDIINAENLLMRKHIEKSRTEYLYYSYSAIANNEARSNTRDW